MIANIAPYEEDRKYNKELIESNGGIYIEVFVNTPLEVCKSRDIKGLYKLAQEGKINLTGVNDPFEIPTSSDIIVDGSKPIESIIENIMLYVKNKNIVLDQ